MSEVSRMRRALAPRSERVPGLVAIAGLIALVTVGFAVPAAPVPVPGNGGGQARVARVCFTTDGGSSLGVGSNGPGVGWAALAAPTAVTGVTSPAAVRVGKDPVRLSTPRDTPATGVVAASAATGPERGLSLTGCASSRSEHWFTGVRSEASAQSDLVLVNLDAAEAVVNVAVFGPDGERPVAGGRGVVVAGQSRRVLALGPLTTASGPLTVRVGASSGRVAAVVRQRLFSGTSPGGADWIAASAPPAQQVIVPVVPAGAGARTLVIGNTEDRTAQVTVEVLGPDAPYAPVGVEQVDVPANATRSFELSKALSGKAVALRLMATRAIVGAVEARTGGDVAIAVGARPVGTGAPYTVPVPAGVSLSVAVANPGDAPATVDLVAVDAAGADLVRRTGVVVNPGAALVLPVKPAAVTVLRVTSSEPALRVGVVAGGTVGGIPGLAAVALEDTTPSGPAISIARDPAGGS